MTPLLLALASTTAARAEIAYGESLDWLAADADLVATGRVVEVGDTVRIGDVTPIRGEGPTALAVANGCGSLDPHVGEHVLVFLRTGPDGWVPRCATDRALQWAVSLAEPRAAYTIDGRVLTVGAEVVAYVTEATARPMSRAVLPAGTADGRYLLQQGPMSFEVSGTPAGNALWMGSTVFLGVPAYADLRDGIAARTRSARPDEREHAARQLANYPGADVERVLRDLLADPYVAEHISEGSVVARTWPVREAAWTSLRAHGADLSGLEDPTVRQVMPGGAR